MNDKVRAIVTHRRFIMVQAYIFAAKSTVGPALHSLDAFRRPEVDADGARLSARHVAERIAALPMERLDEVFAASAVGTANLGYAFEHAFKLCIFLQTGQNTKLKGRSGHDLARLFDQLDDESQSILERLNEGIDRSIVDYHIEESINKPGTRKDRSNVKGFRNKLERLHNEQLLTGSRYVFSDAGASSGRFRIFLPFKTIRVLDMFLSDYLAAKLGVAHEPLAFDAVGTDRALKPSVEWDGKRLNVKLPNSMLGRTLEYGWTLSHSHVVRIRKAGSDERVPGIILPFGPCYFTPETDGYEAVFTHRDHEGNESRQVVMRISSDDR